MPPVAHEPPSAIGKSFPVMAQPDETIVAPMRIKQQSSLSAIWLFMV